MRMKGNEEVRLLHLEVPLLHLLVDKLNADMLQHLKLLLQIQHSREKFANLNTCVLPEIGPLQKSHFSWIPIPFLILFSNSSLLFLVACNNLLSIARSSLYSTFLKSRIGETDFINPIFTSLSNLALTVGVLIPVSREICRKDLRPSFSNPFRMATISHALHWRRWQKNY